MVLSAIFSLLILHSLLSVANNTETDVEAPEELVAAAPVRGTGALSRKEPATAAAYAAGPR